MNLKLGNSLYYDGTKFTNFATVLGKHLLRLFTNIIRKLVVMQRDFSL